MPRRTEQLGREEGSSPAGMLIMRAGNVSFFSLTNPFYNRKGAEFDTRRGPSPFKKMPFLHVERRLLHARKACSQTLFVTF